MDADRLGRRAAGLCACMYARLPPAAAAHGAYVNVLWRQQGRVSVQRALPHAVQDPDQHGDKEDDPEPREGGAGVEVAADEAEVGLIL
jgi:hypothetical protein